MKTSKNPVLPVTHIMSNGLPLDLSVIMAMDNLDLQAQALTNYLKVRIETVGVNYFQDVHKFAIFAMEHAKKHNNSYQYMTSLVDAVAAAKGARHTKLISWFETYSPASFAETRFITGKGKDNSFWNIDAARSKPYYESTPKNPDVYNLESLLRMCEKAIKKSSGDKVETSQQAKLLEIAATIERTIVPVIKSAIESTQAEEVTESEAA